MHHVATVSTTLHYNYKHSLRIAVSISLGISPLMDEITEAQNVRFLKFGVFSCVRVSSILMIEEVSRCFLQLISSLCSKPGALLLHCYCWRHCFSDKAQIKKKTCSTRSTNLSNPPDEGRLQSLPDVNRCLGYVLLPLWWISPVYAGRRS